MDTTIIEKAILEYMILDNSLNSELLDTSQFSSEKNRLIFKAIKDLKAKGEIIDYVILATKLGKRVESSYIASLGEGVPTGRKTGKTEAYFKNHVNKLLQINKEREAKRLIAEAMDAPDSLSRLSEILTSYKQEETEPIENFSISSSVDALESLIKNQDRGEYWGLNITCFPQLTRALNGLREIVVLSADPKVGKSTFVLQIASDVAGQEVGVIYYDFENGRINLMAREMCRKFKIAYADLFNNKDSHVTGSLLRLRDNYKNFMIITDRGLNIDKIRSHIFQLRKHTGKESVLIVIDSLQKLPMKDLKDRRSAIDRWLRDIEELKAEDPYLTVLMVSELSREGKKPKESGDIEYTGHFILKLKANMGENQINELGDDYIRKLWVEYARDVPISGPYTFRADFRYWEFEEQD